MKPTLHALAPNTPEWLELRKNYRTASELAIVMGISPFTTPGKFKMIKAGLAKQYYSQAMRLGHDTEEQIRGWANAHFGRDFREEIWTRGDYLASLDGIDGDMIVEIKTSSHTYNKLMGGESIPYYEVQVQQQLYCSNAAFGHIVAYCPTTDSYAVSEAILPDPDFKDKADAVWAAFDAMPLPPGDVDASDNLTLYRAFLHYDELKRQADTLADELAKAREALLEFKAEGRNVECNGYKLEYRKGSKRTDYRAACRDAKLNLDGYTTEGDPSWVVKLAPPLFEVDDDE